MALSKTITGTTSSPSLWTYKLVVTETSTDTINRTSTIKVEHFLGRKKGAGSSYFEGSYTIKSIINGSTQTSNKTAGYTTVGNGGWKSIGSHTFTVSNTGNPTNITISGQQTSQIFSPSSSNASGTMDLTVLHLPPTITNVEIEETDATMLALNVPDDTIVYNLSKTQFTITADYKDSATLTQLDVYCENQLIGTSNSNIVVADFYGYNSSIVLIRLTDTLGGITDIELTYENIPYSVPVLENTTIKRKTDNHTVLTDEKATLRLNGSYYSENNVIGNANTITNVEYKIWNTTEPSYTDITASATIGSGSVTISDYEILNIELDKTYNYKIVITDYFGNQSEIKLGTVPTGVPIYTEFRDRVDFIKLTLQGENIFFYQDNDQYIANGLILNGYVSNSTTYLYFNVCLPKSIKNINTITVNSFDAELRGGNGYINSASGYKEYVGASGYDVDAFKVDDYNVRIELKKSSAYTNISNNTLTCARVNLELEFEE